jgi:hypothetical protein
LYRIRLHGADKADHLYIVGRSHDSKRYCDTHMSLKCATTGCVGDRLPLGRFCSKCTCTFDQTRCFESLHNRGDTWSWYCVKHTCLSNTCFERVRATQEHQGLICPDHACAWSLIGSCYAMRRNDTLYCSNHSCGQSDCSQPAENGSYCRSHFTQIQPAVGVVWPSQQNDGRPEALRTDVAFYREPEPTASRYVMGSAPRPVLQLK